jgi:hypothetical protein
MQGVDVKLTPGLPWQKQHSIRVIIIHQQIGRNEWNATFETLLFLVLRVGHFRKYTRSEIPESFEMCWWRRMEKISWVDRVKMKKYYKEPMRIETSYIQKKWRTANWSCHILPKNFFLKHVIEGKIQGMERRVKRLRSYWMALRKW